MPEAPPAAPERPGLVRAIGRWDLTAAIINGVIGSSIFGMPDDLARLCGSLSPLACLFAGLGILTIVLSFAEVASRFDQAGGPYLYAREAFGSLVGFQAGWLTFWIRVTSVGANLNVFVNYLARLWPWADTLVGSTVVMLVVMGVITLINVVGVRQASWSIDLFTVAKLLPLLALCAFGLFFVSPEVRATQAVAAPQWREAILLLIFAYGGFEAPLLAAGEARRPRRDSAFALLTALAVIAGLYMVVQLVVVGLVPNVAGSNTPIADAFQVLIGPAGAALAGVAAMVSVYGWATGSVLQTPRLLFAMAERRELPAFLGRVHPHFRTPALAIVVYAVLSLAFAIYGRLRPEGGFEWNAVVSAIVRLVTYGLTCVSLLVFRRAAWEAQRPAGFRLYLGPPIAILATAFCAWLLATRSWSYAGLLLAFMVVGTVLWLPGRRRTV
jgi:basic amino acid/polyamine antiporter, APA family